MGGTRLGLIAGEGRLPEILLDALCQQGREVATIAFSDETASALAPSSVSLLRCGVAEVGKIMGFLKAQEAKDVLMVGKVDKALLYREPKFDWRAVKLAFRLQDWRDDSLMAAFVAEMEREGLKVLAQMDFLKDLLAPSGVLSSRQPTEKEMSDLRFGFEMAKGIAGLDIGQTVVVKEKTIVAVEAMEGTDETIRRGCQLGGKGVVAVKVSKPRQDPRFDVPVVGEETLRVLAEGGGSALGVEAGRTLVVDLDVLKARAQKANITLVALEGPSSKS